MINKEECEILLKDIGKTTPQLYLKNGLKIGVTFCLNGKHENEYCLSIQTKKDKKGYRTVLEKKYFKNPESALLSFFRDLK